jgi:anaerobic selenocysteine-containing dehydrogenase
MHPETLAGLGAKTGVKITVSINGGQLTVPIAADPAMAPGVLVIPRHHRLEWQVAGETRRVVERAKLTAES